MTITQRLLNQILNGKTCSSFDTFQNTSIFNLHLCTNTVKFILSLDLKNTKRHRPKFKIVKLH